MGEECYLGNNDIRLTAKSSGIGFFLFLSFWCR